MLPFFERCRRDHGTAVSFRLGHRRIHLLSDPALIEAVLVHQNRAFQKHYAVKLLKPVLGNGLLLSEGSFWLKQRRLVQPENIVQHLAQRICPEEMESVTRDVVDWITTNLPANYPWPGNFRELEQCVRNVLVRREYHPLPTRDQAKEKTLFAMLGSLSLSASELTRVYATLIYRQTGSYVASGQVLGVDRRTVKEWLLTEEELQAQCD